MRTIAEALAYLDHDTSIATPYVAPDFTSMGESKCVNCENDLPKFPWCNELDIPSGTNECLGDRSSISINIPAGSDVTVNITPELDSCGDLTKSVDSEGEDTVTNDPFNTTGILDPRDQIDSTEEEDSEQVDNEARYLTLDDLK